MRPTAAALFAALHHTIPSCALTPSLLSSQSWHVNNFHAREFRPFSWVDSSLQNNRKNDPDNDNLSNEEYVRANDKIDFNDLEKKMFDDIPDYGWIRSIEEKYEPLNDPLSVSEIDKWMEKNKLQRKKEKRKLMWRRMFPWISPVATLFMPKKYSYSRSTHSRSLHTSTNKSIVSGPNSGRNLLVTLNIITYIYQIFTALLYLPSFNRILAVSVAGNSFSAAAFKGNTIPQWTRADILLRALGVFGSSVAISYGSKSTFRMGRGPLAAHSMGPFFLDCAHQPYPLSHFQKHRYITSGFLHGSLLHLIMNLRALLCLPSWLENGIGKGIYLSAYLVAIVTGNVAHTLSTVRDLSSGPSTSLCIGASGGICGLYGLMFASLWNMSNSNAAIHVLKQMVWLVAFGCLVPNVSNAGHLGGFIGGCFVGYIFGPGYNRSYSLNRGGGIMSDRADPEFRQMMGNGVYPDHSRALIPLKFLWISIAVLILSRTDLRLIPEAILKSIIAPGSLSGVKM